VSKERIVVVTIEPGLHPALLSTRIVVVGSDYPGL